MVQYRKQSSVATDILFEKSFFYQTAYSRHQEEDLPYL